MVALGWSSKRSFGCFGLEFKAKLWLLWVGVQSEALIEVGVQSEALIEVGVQSEALIEVGVQSFSFGYSL
ncbi:hypothetical protein BGP_3563 [Beggiatoa sp. PS]|nr:hypothetical protein BGP_3563 [Beggiatoa sp. PS]